MQTGNPERTLWNCIVMRIWKWSTRNLFFVWWQQGTKRTDNIVVVMVSAAYPPYPLDKPQSETRTWSRLAPALPPGWVDKPRRLITLTRSECFPRGLFVTRGIRPWQNHTKSPKQLLCLPFLGSVLHLDFVFCYTSKKKNNAEVLIAQLVRAYGQ